MRGSTQDLDREVDAFDAKLDELLAHYAGKFALFKGGKLVDTFTTEAEAYSEGVRRFGTDVFLVRRVVKRAEELAIPALFAGPLHADP